jgi:hypothetical protein
MASEIWRLCAVLAAGLGRAAGGASGIAGAGGATVSGMLGGGAATSGGTCDARRSLTLGRLSRLEIEIIECLRGFWGHQSKVTS